MAKVTVNLPQKRRGARVEIVGLGVFENGTTVEVEGLDEDIVLGLAGHELRSPKAAKDNPTPNDPPVKNETHGAALPEQPADESEESDR